MRNTEYIMISEKEARSGNKGLAKVGVHYSKDAYLMKITTFANPQTVSTHHKNYTADNKRTET